MTLGQHPGLVLGQLLLTGYKKKTQSKTISAKSCNVPYIILYYITD